MIEPNAADADATADRLRAEAGRLRERAALLDHAAAHLIAAAGDGDPPAPRFVTAEDLLDH